MSGRTLRLIGILLALGLVIGCGCQVAVDQFWFAEVGYTEVFWRRLGIQTGIWVIATLISAVFLLGNLALAQQLKYPQDLESISALVEARKRRAQTVQAKPILARTASPQSRSLSLTWLLPIALGLILLLSLLFVQQCQSSVIAWSSNFNQLNGLPPLPDRLRAADLWTLGRQTSAWGIVSPIAYLVVGLMLASTIAVLRYPTVLLGAIAAIESLGFGLILSAQWGRILQWFHRIAFERTDPLFAQDIGFYIFSLPIGQLLEFWLVDLFLYGLLAVALVYLLSGNSLSQGQFIGFSHLQSQHLSALSSCFMLAVCLHYWISRYGLLYSTRGATYGAGYIDVNVLLPAYTVLSLLAGAIALFLLGQAFWWKAEGRGQKVKDKRQGKQFKPQNSSLTPSAPPSSLPPPHLILLGSFLTIALLSTVILPDILQRLIVQPAELAREQPYIRRSIALTRAGFDLENIETETFNPQATLTFDELLANQQTTRNIRLWDTRPLLETNRQLQQIRPYYRFFDADVDRYEFKSEGREERSEGKQPIATSVLEKQQVLIAARELDYAAVPQEAKTWVNEHLVYTHGYGFTLSPVNQVADGGLPNYYVKDIGTGTTIDRSLNTADASIRASIPTANPRLYYGELANTYVMTGTRVQELDYPSGSGNVYNVYDGSGGIAVGTLWHRWLLAAYLKDWRMPFTTDFQPQTKLLFRRNINERIRTIAPFLQYDHDPYLVVADIKQEAEGRLRRERSAERRQEAEGQEGKESLSLIANKQKPTTPSTQNSKLGTQNYLYWMVDAYTTSDRYPYSDPSQLTSVNGTETTARSEKFNYIRNSVKVVIDAYNGSVDFYIADADDPIIQAWSATFPTLFKPLSQMPAALRSHVRYPADFFSVQAERLMTYHMTDPQVFYNREDLWKVPTEIYGNQPQLVEPYHLITKLTTGKDEEFVLLLPFTPNQRTNLTAWLAARSDGENYGKSLLYVFPKQQLVYGTEQIEARINQDPVISQQISLWNRAGSRAIQGNLLVIPIKQSLLYVEPLYLEAEQNSLPTLVRVIVVYENRIAMAATLDQALQAVFQQQKPTAPAIVRPVQ